MRKTLLFYFLLLLCSVSAQRMVEKPDRGVLAVNKGNNQLFISWRFLATDPEDITFNVYRQIGIATPVKINVQPVTGATNITWNVSGAGLNIASKIIVKPVISGVEGNEEGSWYLNAGHPAGRIVRDYTFQPFPAGYPVMSMKFCWVGDLDGDGQYDFVVDRHPGGIVESETDSIIGSAPPVHLDAYNSNGTFKKTCMKSLLKILKAVKTTSGSLVLIR
jgi:hypothetical protein